MSVSVVGRRYGKALFALAREADEVEAVGAGLRDFAAALQASAELRNLFENPKFGTEARASVIDALAQAMKLPEIVHNAVRMLADRRRVRHVGEIAEAFDALAEARSGRVRAEVITATELPDAYFQELKATLEKITGREVTLIRTIDESLLGGVVTRIGDQVFDGSIKHRLSGLKEELLTTSLPRANP